MLNEVRPVKLTMNCLNFKSPIFNKILDYNRRINANSEILFKIQDHEMRWIY